MEPKLNVKEGAFQDIDYVIYKLPILIIECPTREIPEIGNIILIELFAINYKKLQRLQRSPQKFLASQVIFCWRSFETVFHLKPVERCHKRDIVMSSSSGRGRRAASSFLKNTTPGFALQKSQTQLL